MLEGLDQVDWGRLTDAYGMAEHVPDDIRALTSHNPRVREEALRRLDGTLCHQGSRYRASARAVPFLFEVLKAPETAVRSEIIELLVRLAVGHPVYYLPFGFDPEKESRPRKSWPDGSIWSRCGQPRRKRTRMRTKISSPSGSEMPTRLSSEEWKSSGNSPAMRTRPCDARRCGRWPGLLEPPRTRCRWCER